MRRPGESYSDGILRLVELEARIGKASLTATSHLRPLHRRAGRDAIAFLSLGEAAERARTSKVDIWRAVREGRLSAQRTDDGGFAIDPAELFRVFETQRPEQPAMEQDTGAATEALGQSETSATPETAETNDIAVAFAALGAELKGLLGLPVEKRSNTESHQHDGADLAERNAQLAAELAAMRATAEKAIAEYASLAERLAAIAEARRAWWRRLVG